MDVPLSPRVRRLLDTPTMHHLGQISQLGLVHLVYPGAKHSRLEHSLGVYHNALRLLATLRADRRFVELVDVRAAEAFVLAAILHDSGHWPFCHAVQDMRLAAVPRHESRVAAIVSGGEVARRIAADWNCLGDDVISILAGKPSGETTLSQAAIELLAGCLSGPVDIDKLDYLVRDSLHAGVPYGRNFDASRLFGSMVLHPDTKRPRLAISDKGRTAAEMMVFARYVMFSEVYWHHAVRAATAMLQRLVYAQAMTKPRQSANNIAATFALTDAAWISHYLATARDSPAAPLAQGLFGDTRQLYKRAAEFSVLDQPELHQAISHRPYWWLVACGEELSRCCAKRLALAIGPNDLLIDAPPVKLEVDINMDVVSRDGTVRRLGDVSPVAHSLAHQQFDGHVKRVRVFVRPDLREPIRELLRDGSILRDAIDTLNQGLV